MQTSGRKVRPQAQHCWSLVVFSIVLGLAQYVAYIFVLNEFIGVQLGSTLGVNLSDLRPKNSKPKHAGSSLHTFKRLERAETD